jgi:hypothetical protein
MGQFTQAVVHRLVITCVLLLTITPCLAMSGEQREKEEQEITRAIFLYEIYGADAKDGTENRIARAERSLYTRGYVFVKFGSRRFVSDPEFLRSLSDDDHQVRLEQNGGPGGSSRGHGNAMYLSVYRMRWLSNDQVVAAGGKSSGSLSEQRGTYTLVRRAKKWSVTDYVTTAAE